MSQPLALISPEKQANGRLMPPKHSRFQPGHSGNPGGQQKGAVYVAEAYKRFGRMTVAELENLDRRKQLGVIEAAVVNMLLRAAAAKDWQSAHAALKEITDRIEGKPIARKEVSKTSVNLDISGRGFLEFLGKLGEDLTEEQAAKLLEMVASEMDDDE